MLNAFYGLRRREQILLGLAAVLVLVLLGAKFFNGAYRYDLGLLRLAGARLAAGEEVYRLADHDEQTKSPLLSLLFVPLASIPQRVLSTVWDFLNLAVFVGVPWLLLQGPFVALTRRRKELVWVIVALAFTLNAHLEEFGFGQYNVIGFFGILWAAQRGGLSGILALSLSMLLKPTNVVFLPWVLRERKIKARPLLLGCTAVAAVLALIYAIGYGGLRALIADHRSWLHVLPISCQRHLGEGLGLPSYFAGTAWASAVTLPFSILSIVASVLAVYFLRSGPALVCTAVFSIVFSPMAWRQNFALLTPLVFALWQQFNFGAHPYASRLAAGSLILMYVALQVANPSFIGNAGYEAFFAYKPHLWVTLIGLAALFAGGEMR